MDNSIDTFNNKFTSYQKTILNTRYFFEITKCCGYSELITVFNKDTLQDLYNTVRKQFMENNISGLYVINLETNEKLLLPNEEISIRLFIVANQLFFRPIYPVPSPVVYIILYDDDCCHNHDNNNLCILHK